MAQQARAGTLALVLQDFEPAALPVQVLHRAGRQAPQRLRAFLDLAVERLRHAAALR